MIPVKLIAPPKLLLKAKAGTLSLGFEPRLMINLAGSKTITVINVDGGGASITLNLTTGSDAVNGGRVVTIENGKIVYWQPDSPLLPIGISITSASANSSITVISSGKATMAGWGLTANTTYYATANGVLSTNPAASRYQLIGTTITSETIVLNIQQPINTI